MDVSDHHAGDGDAIFGARAVSVVGKAVFLVALGIYAVSLGDAAEEVGPESDALRRLAAQLRYGHLADLGGDAPGGQVYARPAYAFRGSPLSETRRIV